MTNRIRDLRNRQNLTLEELATKAGTTNQTIQRIETGKRKLTHAWMVRLAPHLGVQPEDLIIDRSAEEDFLLKRFRALSDDGRKAVLVFVETMLRPFPTADRARNSG